MIRAKKSLGQNFLIDNNIIKKIVNLGNISSKDIVLEIGPGTGNLTKEILNKKPKKIFLIEKDKLLVDGLIKKYQKDIEIFNSDILKFDESQLSSDKLVIFGNLPYNISTQILVKWIINNKIFHCYKKLILMFQKDVAVRIISKVNEKNFGRLSVIANWRLNIEKNFDVPNTCFFPKPKVESTVLTFTPKKNYVKFNNPKNLELITREFFSKKRKMINKVFYNLFNDNLRNKLNLDLSQRPSNLDSEIYYSLTKEFENLRN